MQSRIEEAGIYEQVFESWLLERGLQYSPVDQSRRQILLRNRVKSFDFLVYPPHTDPVVVEVKGRTFKGKSLAGRRGLDCWVTLEDVRGLLGWVDAMGAPWQGAIVFVFRLAQVDVEVDTEEVYPFANERFALYTVGVEEYRAHMKRRSPKWETVTLPAAVFRRLAVSAQEYFQ